MATEFDDSWRSGPYGPGPFLLLSQVNFVLGGFSASGIASASFGGVVGISGHFEAAGASSVQYESQMDMVGSFVAESSSSATFLIFSLQRPVRLSSVVQDVSPDATVRVRAITAVLSIRSAGGEIR